MYFKSNAAQIKRSLLINVVRLYMNGELEQKIDRIMFELYPKDKAPFRCCIHKDRAIVKSRLIAILGFGSEDEKEEWTLLSEYAKRALDRDALAESILTIIDDACSSCPRINYFVTNVCRGCITRSCMTACPKKAITMKGKHAYIDQELCVNCGLCQKGCPYNAIVYIPIPCEQACPVDAIHKEDDLKVKINKEKCISCGKCIVGCPFGAIIDKSQIIDALKAMKTGRKLVAMLAPAAAVQFNATPDQLAAAFRQSGFDAVIEVAAGADRTAQHEAAEFEEKLAESQGFMTTSCCPVYTEAVKKDLPELEKFVSDTPTPLYFTAQIAKEKYPDHLSVFISPCVAKKSEGLKNPNVDFVLTLEETGALFEALNIDPSKLTGKPADLAGSVFGKGFGAVTGVAKAVQSYTKEKIKPVYVSGLSPENLKLLKSFATKGCEGNLVEVMSCEGGCIGGPAVITDVKQAARKMAKLVEDGKKKG